MNKNETEVNLPVSKLNITIRDISNDDLMASLVDSFSSLDFASNKWDDLSDDEQKNLSISVIAKSVDNLVIMDKLKLSTDIMIQYGKAVLLEADELGKRVNIDIAKQMRSDPLILKRNIFSRALKDIGDKMFVWATAVELCGATGIFGDDESIVTKALKEAIS